MADVFSGATSTDLSRLDPTWTRSSVSHPGSCKSARRGGDPYLHARRIQQALRGTRRAYRNPLIVHTTRVSQKGFSLADVRGIPLRLPQSLRGTTSQDMASSQHEGCLDSSKCQTCGGLAMQYRVKSDQSSPYIHRTPLRPDYICSRCHVSRKTWLCDHLSLTPLGPCRV